MANDPLNRMDEALEREIESALGEMSIEDMLDYADKPRDKGSGRESKTGTVVGIHGDDVHVEFGPKSQGICPLGHFAEKPSVGEQLDFIIERFDQNEGLLQLSRRGAVAHAAWDALDVGQTIEARCTGTNKGGLDMEVAGHRAFMPAGQVDLRHVPDLAVFVGEKMPCEIIELDRSRGRVVLSRKQFLVAERAGQREELLAELQEGDDCEATITTLKPYGAFADIGGVDGLIHVSDMSWDRIKDPKEVVSIGDTVKVRVLKLDLSGGDQPRISLGMKQLMDDPFASTSNELEVGATVSGRVTRIADFGAFVELAPGVDGLIHISELAHERVKNVSSVVKQDEVVTVKIVSLDPGSRRIGLSLKAMTEAPEAGGDFSRADDPSMRKLRDQLNAKWGGELRGGL